jgi:hypothetical protein
MIGRIADAHLRAHMEALAADQRTNITLELGIEPVIDVFGGLTARVKHVAQQPVTHACGTENIQRCRVKEPELVLGATGGDVKSLPCGIVGEGSYPDLAWRSHHAQENNMPFIALKRVSVLFDLGERGRKAWFVRLTGDALIVAATMQK